MCSRASLANGPGILQESAIVGESAVNSDRRRAIEPGKERRFLQVIGLSVQGIEDGRSQRSAQRVTNLQIALASTHRSARIASQNGP